MAARLLVPLALFLALAGQVAWVLHAYGDRPFAYVLDDPYIHLTLGRNLAATGVLGVNRGEWASASSSLLWTLLLAGADLLVGDRLLTPLVLNLAVAVGLLAAITAFLTARKTPPLVILALGLVFLVAVPVVPLAFTGMEHLLHLALVLALVGAIAACLQGRGRPWVALRLGFLATACRYESAFVVFGLAVGCLLARRWALAAGLLAMPVLFVGGFGLVSAAHGESLLPNTLLVKAVAHAPGESFLLAKLLCLGRNARLAPPLVALMLASLWLLPASRRSGRPRPGLRCALLAFPLAALLHLTLASVGWFYRYEAYLYGWGLVVIAWGFAETFRRGQFDETSPRRAALAKWALSGVPVLLGILVAAPRWPALPETPRGMAEVYCQQGQMARFVRAYYNQATVALNDIGAVSYYTEARLVDLVGLANHRLAVARVKGGITPEFLDRVAAEEGAQIAICYTDWFRQGPPARWRLVAAWVTPGEEIAVAGQTVGFYALREDPAVLRQRLEAFQPWLPTGIAVRYVWEEPSERDRRQALRSAPAGGRPD